MKEKGENIIDVSERLSLLIKDAGKNANSFSKDLGYNRSQTLYDVLKGKCAPSYDFFKRFEKSEYSVIYEIGWLLTGRGPMRKAGKEQAGHAMAYYRIYKEKDAEVSNLHEEVGRLRERCLHLEGRIRELKRMLFSFSRQKRAGKKV